MVNGDMRNHTTPAGAEFTVPSATGAPMVIKLFSLATHNAPGAYGHLGGQ